MGFNSDEDNMSNMKALRDSLEIMLQELDNKDYDKVRYRINYILRYVL
jgi:hypothetical protein